MTTLSSFFDTLALHDSVKPVSRRCIVCDMSYLRSPQAEHRLCTYCVERAGEIIGIADAHLERIKQEEAAAMSAWVERQAELPDDISERWAALVAARTQAEMRLDRMERGRFNSKTTDEQRRTMTEQARTELARLQAKIARTRAVLDNPLSPLIKGEEQHKALLSLLGDQRCRWEMARSDVEIILGEHLD